MGRPRTYVTEELVELGKQVGNIGADVWEKRRGLPSLGLICKRFGSWNKFMRECGNEINEAATRRYTREEILGLGKKFSDFSFGEWNNHSGLPNSTTITRYFGSWTKFREECGCVSVRKPNGYWKDFGNIERELKSKIRELGNFPTVNQIEGGLNRAINVHHGGINAVREKMGYELLQRKGGHWDDFENVRKELEPLIRKLGHFPSRSEFTNMKKDYLYSAIGHRHGGLEAVKKKMGVESTFTPSGHWKNFGNIQKKLEQIIEELGHFPTSTELCSMGLSGFNAALGKYHGGISKVREDMGQNRVKRPNRYYEPFEKIQEELILIIEKLGRFPTQQEINDTNKGLNHGISKYHGGLGEVAKKMRSSLSRKIKGHWKNFGNVKEEIEQIIGDLGHFPTTDELKKIGRGDLQGAIATHHGGIRSVRKKMGYNPLRKSDNHYKDFDVMKEELESIIEELGHFPSHTELGEMGFSTLSNAVTKFPGGTRALRERMGHTPEIQRGSYWTDFENIERELRGIIDNIGHFPTSQELIGMGCSGMVSGFRHHGGINSVKEKMGYRLSKKRNNFWKDFNNLTGELEPIIKEIGHFPTQQELVDLDRKDIINAFKHHGGMDTVRLELGYELNQKPKNYWSDFENVKRELEGVIEELGHFPIERELRERKMHTLATYLSRKYGGVESVKEEMGYGDRIPDELEEELKLNLESDEQALEILKHFSDNEKDVADLLRVLDPEKFRSNTYRILSLGTYLGRFRSQSSGTQQEVPEGLIDGLEDLLDKDDTVRDIILKKACHIYEQKYQTDSESALAELETKVEESEGNLKYVYENVLSEIKDLDSYNIPGAKESLE